MVLVSHRYNFIYFKNFRSAGSSVESFFGQFCVDPAQQESYDFSDKIDLSISPYGIISARQFVFDKNGESISTPETVLYFQKLKAYTQYKNQLHNPTTANTAIPNSEIVWYNFKDALNVMEDLGENMFTQYTKFCVVRNPYEVVVSSYHYATDIVKKNTLPFNEFCKNFCKNINTIQLSMNDHSRIFMNDQPVCDYYIRYENLQQDIQILMDKLGITDYDLTQLPHHKPSNRPDISYRSYYDDETKALVYSVYKKIIDYFNYVF